MKKIIAAVLGVLLIAGIVVLCLFTGGGSDAAVSFPVHIEGAIFSGAKGTVDVDVRFDPAWITKGDNTEYSPDIAKLSAILCADSYFREKDVARGTPNRVLIDGTDAEDYVRTDLLEKLGFTDVRYIESFREKEYGSDENDSVTMLLGYMNVDDRYDLFVMVVRGCFSSGEWISVFDPGSDSDEYTAYTGEHYEWVDREIMKGFGVAANRAREFGLEYFSEHDDPAREDRVLVTGHSRGGSIAGIIGAHLEGFGIRSFTYAFNPAAVSLSGYEGDCRTVFNIYDSGDFFSDVLPFGDEKFTRIGRELTYDVSASEDVTAGIEKLQGGTEYVSLDRSLMEEYREIFSERFPCRDGLYVKKTATEEFSDSAAASARAEELNAVIGAENGLGLETFVSAVSDGNTVTLEYCDGALLVTIGKILAYGESAADAAKTLFSGDGEFLKIADFLIENGRAITGGHLLINGYVLADYIG